MKTPRTFEVFEDTGGKWRWRCVGKNGAIVSGAQESFDTSSNAMRAARKEASYYAEGNAKVVKKDSGNGVLAE
jgi:uncharacterized protein YegP (UPF0339 family)